MSPEPFVSAETAAQFLSITRRHLRGREKLRQPAMLKIADPADRRQIGASAYLTGVRKYINASGAKQAFHHRVAAERPFGDFMNIAQPACTIID